MTCALRILAPLVFVVGALEGPASAATFTVTRYLDRVDHVCDADCSLRDAVLAANAKYAEGLVLRILVDEYKDTIRVSTSQQPLRTATKQRRKV